MGTIASNGAAEDSELELKFVRSMQTLANNNGWTFEKKPDDTSYFYQLQIEDEDNDTELIYHIKPQFELTVAYGVRKVTIPDFQIMCAYARIDGVEIVDKTRIPWFAVYLDGYAYHAIDPNMRFYADFEKREGIKEAKPQRMFSWTLTWEDISLFEQEKEDEIGLNSVARLGKMLENPQIGAIKENCFWAIKDMDNFLGNGGAMFSGSVTIDDNCDAGLTEDSTDEEVEAAFTHGLSYDIEITKGLRVADKDEWIGFWRRYNLLQFFCTSIGEEQTDTNDEQIDREEIKMFYPGMEDIIDLLLDNGVSFSHDGMCELTDDDNEVVACADLIIDSPLIAVNPATESDQKVFEERGYKVVAKEEFNIGIITNKE